MAGRSFSEFVSKWEKSGLKFYRNCMRITNQFSTKYILENVLQKQNAHVTKILSDIGTINEAAVESEYVDKKITEFIKKVLIDEFDRENLNFVEVNKLAIRMSSYYREMYIHLKENETQKNVRNAIEKIVANKTGFIEQLTSEFERLSYDQS